MTWRKVALTVATLVVTLLGSSGLAFNAGEVRSDEFWLQTLSLLDRKLTEAESKNDALVERLLARSPCTMIPTPSALADVPGRPRAASGPVSSPSTLLVADGVGQPWGTGPWTPRTFYGDRPRRHGGPS